MFNRSHHTISILAGLLALIVAGGLIFDPGGMATLGAAPSKAAASLCINEVQNHNVLTLKDENGDAPSWIEIINTGGEPVSLHGLCLTRDQKFNRTLVFPDITLEPDECVLVLADGSAHAMSGGKLHAPFKLPKSGGTVLTLYDAAGALIDSVEVPATAADAAWARNAQGQWEEVTPATPGADNRTGAQRSDEAVVGEIALNEVVTDNISLYPDEAGRFSDYIELKNVSAHPVNLKGYGLTDNAEKPDKFRFPDLTLPAGGLIVLHCDGEEDTSNAGHLHAAFKLSEGETVQLTRPDGAVVSTVLLPRLRTNQAYSCMGDEWGTHLPPTPNMENTLDSVLALDRPNSMIYISEVMALATDEQADWVEIYNATDAPIDLNGCGLSDNPGKPRRWQFPQGTTIGAGERLAVFLVGTGSAPEGYLSAPFGLSGDGGEAVCLSDPTGQILDILYLPEQYSGISYGRDPTLHCGYFEGGTPLKANGTAMNPPRQVPAYSTPGGLYTTGQTLSVTMTAPTGGEIYYTLDCSDPDQTSNRYTGEPISITGTTILRTRVYQSGCLPSMMDTQSYLFDVNNASDVAYVVSLVSDPKNLYDDDIGIMAMGRNPEENFPYGDYGKGANFWMDWEREAHVELFTQQGTAISQECGIKLHGRNTRAYELKSFKVMAKARYGKRRFSYPLFSHRPWDEYEAFILRYSGQDYKAAFMRDAVLTRQAENTSVMYMEHEMCICYLNGKYYSAMYLRENISAFSLARHEGWAGQEEDLDLIKAGNEVKQGSDEAYAELKSWLETHDANTQEVYDRIEEEVDIDNFIDFITLQIVFGTPDTINVKRYRNTNADGKWRWCLYDLDRAMRNGKDGANGFEVLAQGTNRHLFMAFMKNDALRDRFLTNLNTALATYLSSQALTEACSAQLEILMPLLPDYLENLGVSQSSYRSSYKSLLATIKVRPALVLQHCQSALKLSNEEMRTRFAEAYRAIEDFKSQEVSG